MDDSPEIEINTEQYEAHHGKKPAANKRGDWHFYVPGMYGKRPWLFLDMTYAAACKEVKAKATAGGVFWVAP